MLDSLNELSFGAWGVDEDIGAPRRESGTLSLSLHHF